MLKSSRGASQLGHPYLSLLLVVLLGIGISMSSPSAAADATDDTGDSSPPGSLVNATPTTNTYQSSDGTFVTDIYADSVNYIDDSGTIQPIDATLTPFPARIPTCEIAPIGLRSSCRPTFLALSRLRARKDGSHCSSWGLIATASSMGIRRPIPKPFQV